MAMIIQGGKPQKNKYVIVFQQIMNLLTTLILYAAAWSDICNYPGSQLMMWYTGIVFGCVSIIVVFSKLFSMACYDGLTKQEICRKDLLIGYGGISICGYISLILALAVGKHPLLITTYFICNLLPAFFIPLFILPHLKLYQVKHTPRDPFFHRFYFILTHVTIFLTCLLFVYKFGSRTYHRTVFTVITLNFFYFMCANAEFLVVLTNGVWLRGDPPIVKFCPAKPKKMITVQYDTLKIHMVQQESSSSECGICLNDYDSSVVPRVLVGCGHTICEGCIEKLKKNFSNKVSCPFCRRATELPDGDPKKLPENQSEII
ncbi:hypothetical protein CAEBREN_23935 [Caenorhabditis brenneri]|uniref:RING-type domain-containing protein n=1 Tax=Caenorhabditis brenneri TaxID=135651 RepID=G0N7Z7_CAEBE|nr:hypothetical protein CAEBREN_23935 [Caenorhabditis brenneri]